MEVSGSAYTFSTFPTLLINLLLALVCGKVAPIMEAFHAFYKWSFINFSLHLQALLWLVVEFPYLSVPGDVVSLLIECDISTV